MRSLRRAGPNAPPGSRSPAVAPFPANGVPIRRTARAIALSNDAAHDPLRPFWIVGEAADGPGEPDRRWHAAADALWAGEPPADGATRIPHPAVRLLAGNDLREREGPRTIVPLTVSWNNGSAHYLQGIVWFSDESALPLAAYSRCCTTPAPPAAPARRLR